MLRIIFNKYTQYNFSTFQIIGSKYIVPAQPQPARNLYSYYRKKQLEGPLNNSQKTISSAVLKEQFEKLSDFQRNLLQKEFDQLNQQVEDWKIQYQPPPRTANFKLFLKGYFMKSKPDLFQGLQTIKDAKRIFEIVDEQMKSLSETELASLQSKHKDLMDKNEELRNQFEHKFSIPSKPPSGFQIFIKEQFAANKNSGPIRVQIKYFSEKWNQLSGEEKLKYEEQRVAVVEGIEKKWEQLAAKLNANVEEIKKEVRASNKIKRDSKKESDNENEKLE